MTQETVIKLIVTFAVGGVFLLAYLLGKRSRGYLMYMGLFFVLFGISQLMTSAGAQSIVLLLALAVFAMSVVDGVQQTRAGLRNFREEQRQREQAFAERLNALAERGPLTTADDTEAGGPVETQDPAPRADSEAAQDQASAP